MKNGMALIAVAVAFVVALSYLSVDLGTAVTAAGTAALALFGGLQIQHRREDEQRRQKVMTSEAGYVAFFLRRQLRSWVGDPPARHEGLRDWLERVAEKTRGGHFDRAEARLERLLKLAPGLPADDGARVEVALQRFAAGTNHLNVYLTLSEGERARSSAMVASAEAELRSCIGELDSLIPTGL